MDEQQQDVSKLAVRNWSSFLSKVGGCFELFCNSGSKHLVDSAPDTAHAFERAPSSRLSPDGITVRQSLTLSNQHYFTTAKIHRQTMGQLNDRTRLLSEQNAEILRLYKAKSV